MSDAVPIVVPLEAFEAGRHGRADEAVRRKVEACATAHTATAPSRKPSGARATHRRAEHQDRPWRSGAGQSRRPSRRPRSDRGVAQWAPPPRPRPKFAPESGRPSARGLCNKCSDSNWERLLPKFRDAIAESPDETLDVILQSVGKFDEQADSLVGVLRRLSSDGGSVAAGLAAAATAFWDARPLSLPCRPDPKLDYAAFCDVGCEGRRRVNLALAFLRLGAGPAARTVAAACLERIAATIGDADACSDVAIRVARGALAVDARDGARDGAAYRATFSARLCELLRDSAGRVKDARTKFDVEDLAAACVVRAGIRSA